MADSDEQPVLDDEAWARGKHYWRALVDEILVSLGQTDEWPSAEHKFYGDGITPIPREGVSICDGRSWLLDRSFSIQQFPSSAETATIFAHVEDWAAGLLSFPDINNEEDIDRFFDEGPPDNRVPRSTLSIKLHGSSDATAACARFLLTAWLRPEANVREMQTLIEVTPGLDHW